MLSAIQATVRHDVRQSVSREDLLSASLCRIAPSGQEVLWSLVAHAGTPSRHLNTLVSCCVDGLPPQASINVMPLLPILAFHEHIHCCRLLLALVLSEHRPTSTSDLGVRALRAKIDTNTSTTPFDGPTCVGVVAPNRSACGQVWSTRATRLAKEPRLCPRDRERSSSSPPCPASQCTMACHVRHTEPSALAKVSHRFI